MSEDPVRYAGSDYESLWSKTSYTGWLTLPRVLMLQMPSEWQDKMAALLEEYDSTWNIPEQYWCDTEVSLKRGGKYISTYDWIENYKYPDVQMFNSWKDNANIHQRST